MIEWKGVGLDTIHELVFLIWGVYSTDWIGVLFEFMFFVDTLDSRTVNTHTNY
jgi:hypothetical protein